MGSDNVNKTAPTEKHDGPSKSHTETNADAWGAKSGGSDIKIAANPSQAKPEEHGFLNVDFKGMGDAFNQAMHNTQEMISNIGKPSPEQVAAQQRAQAEKEAKEAASHTADDIWNRMNNRSTTDGMVSGETVKAINKQLHDLDWTQRKAVIENLKGKFNMRVEEKNGDYEVRYGGGLFGTPGEQLYP